MKIKDKIALQDLYFGYVNVSMSYDRSNKRHALETYNLFGSSRVRRSVALYVTMDPEKKKELVRDPLSWCFSDVRSRCEYEFVVNPWPYGNDDTLDQGVKVDIWTMYVEPNRELLLDLISRVTKTSAQKYLREERKRYKR